MPSFFSPKWNRFQWFLQLALSHVSESSNQVQFTQSRKTILCVDDDVDFCAFVEHCSANINISIKSVHSSQQAKLEVEHENFDAFIIDGYLLDSSGFELVSWLRQVKHISSPIGFISRIYQDATSFRTLKEILHVNYVLEKPISSMDMQLLIRQLCLLDSEPPHPSHDYLMDIKESYKKSIVDKIERLEKLIIKVQKNLTLENLEALSSEVHKLAGSSGSYGYHLVSQLCKDLEKILRDVIKPFQKESIDFNAVDCLDDFFTQVKLAFQLMTKGKSDAISLTFDPSTHIPSIYIVADAECFSKIFDDQDKDRALDIYFETNPEIAIQKLTSSENQPQILIVKSHYPGKEISGLDIIKVYKQKGEKGTGAAGFLTLAEEVVYQVEAISRGVEFLLVQTTSIHSLLPLLEKSSSLSTQMRYSLLVIDDDADTKTYIIHALKDSQISVHPISTIEQFEADLKNYKPDIVLIDVNIMNPKEENALRLTNRIPRDYLLVAMSSATPETKVIESIYENKVDDILFKPIEGIGLQKRLLSILSRYKQGAPRSDRDIVTGLLNREFLHSKLQHLNSTAAFDHSLWLLSVFEIQDYKSLISKIGVETERKILSAIALSLDDLLLQSEAAFYLDHGRFALLYQNLDANYLHLVISSWLQWVQQKKINTSFLNQCNNIIFREGIVRFPQSYPDWEGAWIGSVNPMNSPLKNGVYAHQPCINRKPQVLLICEEQENLIGLESFLKSNGFSVQKTSHMDYSFEVWFHSLEPIAFPLMILIGSLADTWGGFLAKKIEIEHRLRIPMITYPILFSLQPLFSLLQKLNYPQCPFGLMICIEQLTGSKDS